MKHANFYYCPTDQDVASEFTQFLETLSLDHVHASVLVQVFSSVIERQVLQSLLSQLVKMLPKAVVIGASTAGEVDNTQLKEGGVLFSVTHFDSVQLTSVVSIQPDAFAAGVEIAQAIIVPTTRCLIAFADGVSMNGESLIQGIDHVSHGAIPIAGGMSGDGMRFQTCFVMIQDRIIERAAVAVALNSDCLQLWQHNNLSWRPIGRSMTITKSEGNRLYEIDNRPVVDVYRDYLGEEVVANLPGTATEFPLILEQQGVYVARSMITAVDDHGALFYAGDIPQGVQVRFGIASAQLLSKGRETLVSELLDNTPEVIFTYSCVARRMFLGASIEAEFSAMAQVAPVAGFLTYGEFYATGKARQLLNITTTTLALRETLKKEAPLPIVSPPITASLTTHALLTLTDKVLLDLAEREQENTSLNDAIDKVLIVSRANPAGIITYANDLFCRISGYSRAELIGRPHSIVRHPDMSPAIFKEMWASITQGQIWHGIVKNKTKDGAAYYVKTFIVPKVDHHGQVVEYLGIREDITDLIQTQDSLREQQQFTQTVMDLSEDIVLIMKNEKPYSLNAHFFKLFDFIDIEDFKSRHQCICELFSIKEGFLQHSTDDHHWFEPILLHPEQLHKASLVDKWGKVRIYEVSVRTMPFRHHYLIASFHEITEIEQAKESALMAKTQQEQFLASMSHEIRTPLNGVLGFLGLLGDTPLDETQQRYLDIIKNSSQTLMSIINDILDLSKINQGAMRIDPHAVNLKQELPLFASLYEASAQHKQIDYRVVFDSALHTCLMLDWLRMKQIIGNLVGNAIKFTPEHGKVKLTISLLSQTETHQTLLVSVQDTGIGIAPEKQKQVFEAFSQADGSTARQYGGTGLGLSISAKLAQLMGSQLSLRSELGKGSEFFMQLTVPCCGMPEVVTDSSKATKPLVEASSVYLSVLVAEDNATNRMLIKALLAKQNIVPDFAENGLEAVRMVSEKSYDLVLMDIQMPFLDGMEATKQIRAAGFVFPIVALTANALDGEREKLLAIGMDDYLSKPIDVAELTRVIQHYRDISDR